VLTGESIEGKPDMIRPPLKEVKDYIPSVMIKTTPDGKEQNSVTQSVESKSFSAHTYESTVDMLPNPRIYVIYDDAASFPLMRVILRRKMNINE
jgi:hypothetical protein